MPPKLPSSILCNPNIYQFTTDIDFYLTKCLAVLPSETVLRFRQTVGGDLASTVRWVVYIGSHVRHEVLFMDDWQYSEPASNNLTSVRYPREAKNSNICYLP